MKSAVLVWACAAIVAFSCTGSALGAVRLTSGGNTSSYGTIQAAVDAAVDGDIITADAGTYIEQVTITKAITLQGAGIDRTIIQSPATANLVQSGGNWKNLKAQDIYAVVGIRTNSSSLVTVRSLTVDGHDQGRLSLVAYPDRNNFDFQGIGVYNSTATIDTVKVTGVRELAADDGTPLPPGYTPADQPSGMNHNASVAGESTLSAGAHTLTIVNSYITKFQKPAIQAWGPTLTVDIHNNTIQGYGRTLWSSGNAIQIASSDRSSQGGANGDRRGTTGKVTNNRILGIGLVIPEPGQAGSYLNLGLAGPAGVLLYQAGSGFEVSGNTITGPGVFAWHNSITSSDGGYNSLGIAWADTPNIIIRNNTLSGFDGAVTEDSAVAGSHATIEGNTFSNNAIDVLTASGDDAVSLAAGNHTVGFTLAGAGVDTLAGFGLGDRIYVFGSPTSGTSVNGLVNFTPVVNFTGGTVSFGTGASVAARSVEIEHAAGQTILHINTNGVSGTQLTVKLDGLFTPDQFVLNGGYIGLGGVPFNTVPAGLAFTVKPAAGPTVRYTAPELLPLIAGQSYVITAAASQTREGETGTKHDFGSWSDNGQASHTVLIPGSGSPSYTANYITKYQLTTAVSPAGAGTVSPAGTVWIPKGTSSNLAVLPAAGYALSSWTADSGLGVIANASATATTILVNGPVTATANMAASAVANVDAVLQSKSGTTPRTWNLVLRNNGAGTAYGARITGLEVSTTTTGTCRPAVTSSLPMPAGGVDVAAGNSSSVQAVTIDFSGCSALARYNVKVSFQHAATSGGTLVDGYTLLGNQTK